MKRILTVLLCAIIAISFFGVSALAADGVAADELIEAETENAAPDGVGTEDIGGSDDESASDIEGEGGDNANDADAGEDSEPTDEGFDLRGYVEGTLIPAAVTALAAISAFYVAACPIISKIKKIIAFVVERVNAASDKFTNATDRVNNADAEKARTDEQLAAMKNDIAEIKAHLLDVERIERIGFGNMKELVVGGFAREIGKVGKTDEGEG